MSVKPEQVPDEAHNAAFEVYEKKGGCMSAAIAAALNAWPNGGTAWKGLALGVHYMREPGDKTPIEAIILPL